VSSSSHRQSPLGFRCLLPYCRAETLVFVVLWLVLMVGGRSRLFHDPGTLWHPVVGERILSTRHLICTDPFSFTRAGQPWIAQWWLADCLLASLHRLAGLDSILLFTATVLAGFFTWIVHRLICAGIDPPLAALMGALAMLASSYHFHPRPHLATIMLLAWTFSRLCAFEAGRIPLVRLFWLIPVFILWTNLHGGMVGGLATMILAVLGWCAEKTLTHHSRLTWRQMAALVALSAACAMTALVNPYGLELPRAWFALFYSPVLPRLIDEHAPLLAGASGWPIILFGAVYVVALLGILPARPRVTWLIPLIWFGLAFTRVRHGPLFAVTAVIALADIFPHIRWAAWLARRGSDMFRVRAAAEIKSLHGLGWRWAPLALAPVAVTLACQVIGVSMPVFGAGWARLDPAQWPMEILPQLRQYEQEHPPGTPIFNEMLFGGFLIYYTPALRVFIDDRCELYGDEGLLEYADALVNAPRRVDEWRDLHGFDAALTIENSPFDRYLKTAHGWNLVAKSDAGNFYRWNPVK
jgi:hypothetical protein